MQVAEERVQVGDVVKYRVPGREVKGWNFETMQFVLEVNEAGDVLTEKDGWRSAGTFSFHRPMARSEREPSLQDWSIFAAGRSWYIHGKPYAKGSGQMTERQIRNGGRRAKLEVGRVEQRNKQKLATTPPLFTAFFGAPELERPRYATAEEANAETVRRRQDFVAHWRGYTARVIGQIRQELDQLDEHTLAAYHRHWDRRNGGQGLVYLISFLRDPGCASAREEAIKLYPRPQATQTAEAWQQAA
jgi:hypothetical protein